MKNKTERKKRLKKKFFSFQEKIKSSKLKLENYIKKIKIEKILFKRFFSSFHFSSFFQSRKIHSFSLLACFFAFSFFSCSFDDKKKTSSSKSPLKSVHEKQQPHYDGEQIEEDREILTLSVPPIDEKKEEITGEELEKAKQKYEKKQETSQNRNSEIQKSVVYIPVVYYYYTYWCWVTAYSSGKKVWHKTYIKKIVKRKIGKNGSLETLSDTGYVLRKYNGWYKDGDPKYNFAYTQQGDKTLMQRWNSKGVAYVNVKVVNELQPISLFVGSSASLSSGIYSPLSLTYEWYKNGILVDTTASFSIPHAQQSQEGVYQLIVRQGGDYLKSRKIGVIVVEKPTITLNNNNPFDISESFSDGSIEKISKYKWIDAGNGNYDLEVTLQLKLNTSPIGGGAISSIRQVGEDSGLAINRSLSVINSENIVIVLYLSYVIYKNFFYSKDPAPWSSISFLKHYVFGKGEGITLTEIGLANKWETSFKKKGKDIKSKADHVREAISKVLNNGDTYYQVANPHYGITNYNNLVKSLARTDHSETQINPFNSLYPLGRVNINVYWQTIIGHSKDQYQVYARYYFPFEKVEQPFDANADWLYKNLPSLQKIRYNEPGTPYKVEHEWSELVFIDK